MKRLLFVLQLLLVGTTVALAQEICDNGIDDDFDGFTDCYDSDCSTSPNCSDFYIGRDVLCEAVPSAFPQFTMTLDFASPNETTNHIGRMSIGDLDRDGIPEIVTMNRYTDMLYILNGSDGSIKDQQSVDFEPLWEIALGNINDDNCAELFFQGIEDDDLYIYAYDCNLNQLWKRRLPHGNDAIEYGLADFDGDGLIELYVKDMILDAHTGTIIINTAATSGNTWRGINGGPVAVDIIDDGNPNTKTVDDNLELVVGGDIYYINLGPRTANSGTRTLARSITSINANYRVKHEYNATSIADYNLDGFLDVLISAGERISGNTYTTIYFWDVINNTYTTYSDPIAGNFTVEACPDATGTYYQYGWRNGTGRLNVADLDGDGLMNINYVSGQFLYALDENLDLLWKISINEETSGYTGCTLFDFNGDGSSEVVYRDERFLYIIDGTDGSIYSQQACISRTQREYPIVADVDADGSTELCVTCGFDDAASGSAANFCNLGYSRYSHVRVFKSAAEPWVPARRLWNQHGYFNVNVNDDLTIPRQQQKHHLVWSIGNCTVGPNRPLNNFLNQSPFLNSQGCPTYAAPDIAYNNTPSVVPPTCPNGDFEVSFEIINQGDISLSGNLPVSFYNGDPMQAGATKLNTVNIPLSNFNVGQILSVNLTVNGPGSSFTLYIVLNDAGTSLPTPITLPNTSFVECDYDNVISVPVTPLPVSLTALTVQDNIKCVGSVTPDNGAVRAFIPGGGGTENTTDYDFYWSNGPVAQPIASADHVGATYTNLAEGTYTVYAIHKTANCSSDTVSVDVARIDNVVDVAIALESPYDNCKNPNGQLRAVVNGGVPPVGDYTYVWYEGNDIFSGVQIGVSHVASQLEPLTYTVLVTDRATGCTDIESFTVPDQSTIPVVDVVVEDLLCSSSTSGELSASVGGITAGFQFDWYNGAAVKPTPDFANQAQLTNMPAGTYTVVATNNVSKCESLPVTVTLVQTSPPTVTASTTANMTSCDPAQPNGSVSATVGGLTNGFDFEWFNGQNTLPANSIGATPTLTGLVAGIYTVMVTDQVTGCSATAEVTVTNAVVMPTIIVGATASTTSCTSPNGSVTVNVTLDTPADYTFFWYDGPVVKATPDYPDTDNVLQGLVPGEYTVRAVHNTKFCETMPVTATVMDGAPVISIILDDLITQLPSDCNANDGSMTINLSAPGNVGGFDVEWFEGRAPFTAPAFFAQNSVTSSTATNLRSGVYTVVATNRDNGCERSAEFDLPFANAHEIEITGQTDVDQCSPTDIGQIEFDLTKTPLAGFFEGDYEIHVYEGPNDLGLPLGAPLGGGLVQKISGVTGTISYATNSNLTPGFYTLVAISGNVLTLNCRSVPASTEILQITTDPLIQVTQIDANMNCAGADGTGVITLSIDNAANPANYNFEWFEGPNTSSPVLGTGTSGVEAGVNGEIASSLPAGTYTVRVTNIASNCFSTLSASVFSNPPIMTIGAADISIANVTLCSSVNSSATVNFVTENGIQIPVTFGVNYDIEWFDNGMNPLVGTNTIAGLTPGTYFVRAINLNSTCVTTERQFVIEDMTMNTVNVTLASFIEPTRCLKPTNILGELVVTASGNSTTGYTFNWYDGATATGPVIDSDDTHENIVVAPGQPDITYTVEVINNDNDCIVTDTYVLPVLTAPITLIASAAPNTFCISDNGEVFATVTSGNQFEYAYNWYIGQGVKAAPDFPLSQSQTGLSANDYTVMVVDNMDNTCTATDTVTVTDEQILPTVAAAVMNPLTNCDPTIPNGAASASVGGDIINYTFSWFEGTPPAGLPFFTGSENNSLSEMDYSIIAQHIVSGCSDTTSITIQFVPTVVPTVTPEVLSHVTSCVTGNGALTASVDGNTQDYIFNWYIGPVVTATPDFVGEVFDSLDIGIYTVTATSRITGCTSAPATAEIIEDPQFPDFDFGIQSASCDQEDGYVSLFLLNNVEIQRIEWDNNGVITTGPNLENIPAGVYSVTVTSFLGCSTTKQVEILTEIHPFNGISRNNDGRNDKFYIDCIDNFPNNIVRIFNRAGTLVYEEQGYDNIDIFFDGQANRGISVLGSNLPDGTYFYVIDKMDGSKPLAGYLEIVN